MSFTQIGASNAVRLETILQTSPQSLKCISKHQHLVKWRKITMSKPKTEERKPTVDELLAKAKKPSMLAPPLHRFYGGKLQVMPKCAISSPADFALWYTPGVAAVCKEIQANKEKSFELTNRWNYVAVVSACTRVLDLGGIGPEAGLPVMEGKGILFKYLGGVDAFPICLKTKDPDEIVKTCELIETTFGGINL